MVTFEKNQVFNTTDDFIDTLIALLQPNDNETIDQRYSVVSKVVDYVFGKDNIQYFIRLVKKYGFSDIIIWLYAHNVKTPESFRSCLYKK